MPPEPVLIIGIGPEGRAGLSRALCAAIELADELWGGERLLALWPDFCRKKVPLGKHMLAALAQLSQRPPGCRVVILASGDPGFYGVAASVLNILPLAEVRIYPQVSFLQAGFAKICLPWNDAALSSAHARPLAEVIGLARRYPKVGLFTDPLQAPARIAEKLLAAGIPDCRAVVIENLGETQEKINDLRLAQLPGLSFAPLNVLLLVHDPGWKPAPTFSPRPDAAYKYKNGLITKRDVRAISLARLGICETDLVWDIGAGSGALSIEMAELAWRGKVFAIEKDPHCLDCLGENVARFGTPNVEIVPGEAPPVLEGLPAADAVFVGGSGGRLVDILARIETVDRGGCRVVANFTLLENLLQALAWMQTHGWEPALTEARFSYGAATGGGTRLLPSNPVFILSGVTPHKEGICPEN